MIDLIVKFADLQGNGETKEGVIMDKVKVAPANGNAAHDNYIICANDGKLHVINPLWLKEITGKRNESILPTSDCPNGCKETCDNCLILENMEIASNIQEWATSFFTEDNIGKEFRQVELYNNFKNSYGKEPLHDVFNSEIKSFSKANDYVLFREFKDFEGSWWMYFKIVKV